MGTVIEIQGTKYPIKFGNGAFRVLGKKWDFPGPQSVMKKISDIFPKTTEEELTFEGMDILAEVIVAGLLNADKNYPDEFSDEEIIDLVIINPKSLTIVSKELIASFPGVSGNVEPRSKARKTATKKKLKK